MNKKRINEIVITPANGGGNVYYLQEDLQRQYLFTEEDIIKFAEATGWKENTVKEITASHCPSNDPDDDEIIYKLNYSNNKSKIFI